MNNSTCINSLKVLATALVFFCHSWITCYNAFAYNAYGWCRLMITPAWGGVWIFLVISGYLAAYGFSGKYEMNMEGVIKYYKNRIVKILIPTWVFISIVYLLIHQDKMITWDAVIRFLTCTFNGEGSPVSGIGATWYIFIVMWLYLLTPVILILLNRIEKIYGRYTFGLYLTILLSVCLLGCIYRVVTYFYLDWYEWTYANVLGCVDLFVAGMISFKMSRCFPQLSNKLVQRLRVCVVLMLINLIVICADFGSLIPLGNLLYRYIWPSAYLILSCLLLLLYAYKTEDVRSLISVRMAKLVNLIAPYTFAYYLWHSSLLLYVVDKLNISDDNMHFILTMVVGFVVSSYMAFLMTKMNNGIVKSLL